jgi:uncharacterized protein YukE
MEENMSKSIKVSPEQLKAQATQMESLQAQYDDLFSDIISNLKTANGFWSKLLANNFLGKITSTKKSFDAVNQMLTSGIQAASSAASGFESVDAALAKLNLGEAFSGVGGISEAFSDATDFQKKLDKAMEKIPKKFRGIMKNYLSKKYSSDDSSATTWKDISGAYEVWQKIADGDYSGAIEKFVNTVGGVSSVEKDKSGFITGINWKGLKIQGIEKVASLCLDKDSYISKAWDREQEITDKMATDIYEGDATVAEVIADTAKIAGVWGTAIGKGVTDVLCQLGSGVIDSAVSTATGGALTASSINQNIYNAVGTSPGHLFNDVAQAISDGVDGIVDDGLVKGVTTMGTELGSAAEKAFSVLTKNTGITKSVLEFLKN